MGLRQAADVARRKGLTALTLNSLGKLERGGTKNPDPALLRDLSTLYGRPYLEVAGKFIAYRYGLQVTSDAIGHSGALQPAGNKISTDGVLTHAHPPSHHPEDQTQGTNQDAGSVASPRLPDSDASIVIEAAEALHLISLEINKLSRRADRWSAKLAAHFADTFSVDPTDEDSVAGSAPSLHSHDVRTHDRQVAGKKRRGKR